MYYLPFRSSSALTSLNSPLPLSTARARQYADPDLLHPPLPEPYRSIDSIVRSIIDDAMTVVIKRDEAERNSAAGWQVIT